MSTAIVNLIPYPTLSSGWSAGTSDYYMGKPCRYLDSKSGSAEVTMATNDSIKLVKGHTYYARVSAFMRFGFGSTVDIYWPIAEPSFLSGRSLTKDKWVVCSNVIIRNSWSNGSYQLRLDNNNTTSGIRVYFAEAMLIDLTATYGAGNEPSAAWCDENIPFFEGTYYTTPSAVTNLSAQAVDGVVSLSWSSSDGATGYKVIRDGTQVSNQTGVTFSETVTKGASYTYEVIAYNAGGESDPASITVSVPLVPPATPSGLSASVNVTEVALSWNAASKATGYKLFRDDVQIADTSLTNYADTVSTGSNYVYKLIAYNSDGESAATSISVTVPLVPPGTPQNFAVSGTTSSSVTLAWSSSAYANGYRLYRDGALIATLIGTSYTDSIQPFTAYVYTLKAYNADGESDSVSLSVQVIIPPEAPSNFRAGAKRMTALVLAWDAVTGADGYQLKRNGTVIYTGSLLSYTDSGLTINTSYTYELIAVNTAGSSQTSTLVVSTADLTLVTDRTAADVDAQNSKGIYTKYDLIRVGEAVAYLTGMFERLGYSVPVFPKTDWDDPDWANPLTMGQYLKNISVLRSLFKQMKTTPAVPQSMEALTHLAANDIEQILTDIHNMVQNLQASLFYSAEIYSGEV